LFFCLSVLFAAESVFLFPAFIVSPENRKKMDFSSLFNGKN